MKLKSAKKKLVLLIPLLLTGFMLATHTVRFIVNDDIAMMRIAESYATNAHSEHLIFMNIFYGYLLKGLYHILPNVNWFVWLELAVLNIAFVSLFNIAEHFKAKVLPYFVLTACELFFLSNLTFTAISFICSVTAMLWLVTYVDKLSKANIKHLAYGLCLFLLAYAMRNGSAFYFTVLLSAPILFFGFVRKRNSFAAVAVFLVLCTVANYSLLFVQQSYKSQIPEDMYYTQFQEYRSDANDGGLFDYERHSEELAAKGISANDYDLLIHWMYGDKEYFDADFMKAIAESRDFDEKYNTDVFDISDNLDEKATLLPLLVTAFVIAFVLFLLSPKAGVEGALSFLASLAAVIFLFFRRRGLERVANLVVICNIVLLLFVYLLYQGEIQQRLRPFTGQRHAVSTLVLVCVLTIGLMFNSSYTDAVHTEAKYEYLTRIAAYVKNDTEHVYFADVDTFNNYKTTYINHNILKPYTNNDIPAYSFLGGWTIYSYYYYDTMDNLELSEYEDSVMSAVLDDHVYFIATGFHTERFEDFFREHYGIEVSYRKLKQFDGTNTAVYDFYVVE